jgi:hypothetical protein
MHNSFMKNIIQLFVVSISLTLLPLGLFAQDSQKFGTVRFVKGMAKATGSDGEFELKQDDEVNTGETISVSEGSVIVLNLHDGSSVRLGPEQTEIVLERHLMQENANAGAKISLKIGEILLEAVKALDDYISFEVEVTKSTSIGVRGTTFYAGVDENDAWVSLKEGSLDVYQLDKNDHEALKPGESIVVEEKKTLTKPTQYDWAKKLDWSNDNQRLNNLQPGTFKNLRQERRQEFVKRATELRQRNPQEFKQKFQERRERFAQRKHEIVGKFKERMQQQGIQGPGVRQKMQERRQEMRQEMRQEKRQERREGDNKGPGMRQGMQERREQFRQQNPGQFNNPGNRPGPSGRPGPSAGGGRGLGGPRRR